MGGKAATNTGSRSSEGYTMSPMIYGYTISSPLDSSCEVTLISMQTSLYTAGKTAENRCLKTVMGMGFRSLTSSSLAGGYLGLILSCQTSLA